MTVFDLDQKPLRQKLQLHDFVFTLLKGNRDDVVDELVAQKFWPMVLAIGTEVMDVHGVNSMMSRTGCQEIWWNLKGSNLRCEFSQTTG